MAPMHVHNAREVPEYEIDPKELDFTNSVEITKVRSSSVRLSGASSSLYKELGLQAFLRIVGKSLLLSIMDLISE